jgi:hypothetical protein
VDPAVQHREKQMPGEKADISWPEPERTHGWSLKVYLR